jgi:hypothetical protein
VGNRLRLRVISAPGPPYDEDLSTLMTKSNVLSNLTVTPLGQRMNPSTYMVVYENQLLVGHGLDHDNHLPPYASCTNAGYPSFENSRNTHCGAIFLVRSEINLLPCLLFNPTSLYPPTAETSPQHSSCDTPPRLPRKPLPVGLQGRNVRE